MIIQRWELYLSALQFPYSVAEPLGLGVETERRLIHLSLFLWWPGVVYAAWLIHKHYDSYREKTLRQQQWRTEQRS